MNSITISQLVDGSTKTEAILQYANSENMLNDLKILENMKNDKNDCEIIIAYFKTIIGPFSCHGKFTNISQQSCWLMKNCLGLVHLTLEVLMVFPSFIPHLSDPLVIKHLFSILYESLNGGILFCEEKDVRTLVISVMGILYRTLARLPNLRTTYRRVYPRIIQLLLSGISGSDIIYRNSIQNKFPATDHHVILTLSISLIALLADESENLIIHSSDIHIKHLISVLDHFVESSDSFTHTYLVDSVDMLTGLIYVAGPDTNKRLLLENGVLDRIASLLKNACIAKPGYFGDILICQILELFWTLCCLPTVLSNKIYLAKSTEICLLMKDAPWSDTCKVVRDGIIRSVFLPYPIVNATPNTKYLHREESLHLNIQFCYHESSKPIVQRINECLLKMGYRSRIHGNPDDIESNFCNIANASCVLVGICHALKNSPRCRQEIRYASNRRIPLLPIILERDYELDGWLGFMLSTLIYVSFIADGGDNKEDAEFQQNLIKLKRQLEKFTRRKPLQMAEENSGNCSVESHVDITPDMPSLSSVLSPRDNGLTEWLTSQGLSSYCEVFVGYSVDVLNKMNYLRKHALGNFLGELRYGIGMPLTDQLRLLRGLTRAEDINGEQTL